MKDAYLTRDVSEVALVERPDPVVWPSELESGPLDAKTLQRYEEDGYIAFDQLFTQDELMVYQEEMARLGRGSAARSDVRFIMQRESGELRSIFEVHSISEVFARLVREPRLLDMARQILGSEVYIHQSRINFKPGFTGDPFYWHSDFETWHAEDGMPGMRAFSISIALTENYIHNGALMVIPKSHRTFVPCVGKTPENHYKISLQGREIGIPDHDTLYGLAGKFGIKLFMGAPGSATLFDCNALHGSNGNITPFPRSNIFLCYNSVENACGKPFGAQSIRPTYLAARDFTPLS